MCDLKPGTEIFNVVEIEWNFVKNIEEAFNKFSNCLYCAYGDSPIYGRDVLLYIGLTTTILTERIKGHDKIDNFFRINNLNWRVGTIDNWGEFESNKNDLLKIVESILICMLKPSYNSQNIRNIWDAKDKIDVTKEFYLILNKNERGALPLEVSNIWWRQ